MVSQPRLTTGVVELLNSNSDQAPENLVAFLDGRKSSSSGPSDPEQERPKKRRKLAGPNRSKTPLHSSDSDDYLTLARVDISLVGLYKSRGITLAKFGSGISEKPKRVISIALSR